jgi:hypothetical protein
MFPWFGVIQLLMSVSRTPQMVPVRRAWQNGHDLRLLAELRKFVRKEKFWEFCEANNKSLLARFKSVSVIAEKEDYAETVSRYAGRRIAAFYEIAVSPLLRDVNLRAILIDDDGGRGARTIICPSSSAEDLKKIRSDDDFILWSGWHEHLHLLVDPWSRLYGQELNRYSSCYESIPVSARRKNWLDCAGEHFVRAVTQRLIEIRLGPFHANRLLKIDEAEGYHFSDYLKNSLIEYELSRDKYASLLDFFPRWIHDWKNFSA